MSDEIAGVEQLSIQLSRIESMVSSLVERDSVRDWYSIEEFAKKVKKADFTVREWCRNGRINAEKKGSGRGSSKAWTVSHEEWLRYQRDGLLPIRRN